MAPWHFPWRHLLSSWQLNTFHSGTCWVQCETHELQFLQCSKSDMSRVGQNHIYTVYIRYFWQGNHKIYGHIRCIYTVLANPRNVTLSLCFISVFLCCFSIFLFPWSPTYCISQCIRKRTAFVLAPWHFWFRHLRSSSSLLHRQELLCWSNCIFALPCLFCQKQGREEGWLVCAKAFAIFALPCLFCQSRGEKKDGLYVPKHSPFSHYRVCFIKSRGEKKDGLYVPKHSPFSHYRVCFVKSRGEKKDGLYMPGVDLRAKVTLLAEGARGSITQVGVGVGSCWEGRGGHVIWVDLLWIYHAGGCGLA